MRAFRRLAGAGLALMLGVVAASAWIRIAASLGEEVALARGLQRAAATATALAVLALAALAWRDPRLRHASLAAGTLFPPLKDIRSVSHQIAVEVARVAYRDGLASVPEPADLAAQVWAAMYEPTYR